MELRTAGSACSTAGPPEQTVAVTVRLFARARDVAGHDCVSVQLTEPATVGAVRRALLSRYPALQPFAQSLLAAVDAEYAADDQPVPPQSEVAFFPPVSGG